MPLSKEKKSKRIEELKDRILRQKSMVLLGITGLKVKDMTELRKRLKKSGGELKVIKKSLANIVLQENKISFDKKKHKTEVALVLGYEDEIMPAKTVYQFSKENDKVQILGGFLTNEEKSVEEVIALAQLPTKPELLSKVVGSISAPVSGFVNVLQGNIKGLIRVLGQIKTQNI
ncbi:MAG: 50S ribosomal protein L10 [Candidatus Pacebacteria bacterium]|nr:50S ribosomal protein L10 [Candidatus Paceibacterota bacterium]